MPKFGNNMSRIGKKPVKIPDQVTVKVTTDQVVVNGPKGELKVNFRPEMKVELKDNQILVTRKDDSRMARCLHGLTRSLINNLVEGVTVGFSKTLKLVGTGYRVEKQGEKIVLSLGFSHLVEYVSPSGVTLEVPDKETIVISGANKALVGQAAATIRDFHKPEPYKGKGIRYENEQVRKKAGKAGKVGAAGVGA